MCLFRKKNKTVAKNAVDEDIVKVNAGNLGVIAVYLEGAPEDTLNLLKELRQTAEYISVSPKDSVKKIDKKISREIEDLKVLLATNKSTDEKTLASLKEIKVLYAERQAIFFAEDK